MNMIRENLHKFLDELPRGVQLIAVSKYQPLGAIQEAYGAGQRLFGESRPQELAAKQASLPKDIEWHMIGHLQTNKVKLIAPFVSLIHSVDSLRLAEAISRQALACARCIDVLLQVHIAREQTKQGFSPLEITELIGAGAFGPYKGIRVRGLMGMGTLTDDATQVSCEFALLQSLYESLRAQVAPHMDTLSMGMSADWRLAVEHGSTMVRIGTDIFGQR